MIVFYRISDGGYNKKKPYYVCNKLEVFKRFYNIFNKYTIYVVADNVCDETYDFLLKYNGIYKKIDYNLKTMSGYIKLK